MKLTALFTGTLLFYFPACSHLDNKATFQVTYVHTDNDDKFHKVGTTARYDCIAGYYPNTTTRTCTNMTWTDTEPTCNKKECNSSLDVLHGFHYPNQTRYLFEDVVHFGCDTGYYRQGTGTIACLSTGLWNTTLMPKCIVKDCGAVLPLVHAFLSNNTNGTTYLSQAYIECDLGFNMSGASVLTCNATGQWTPDIPQCNAISK